MPLDRKEGEATHKTVTEVAQAVSDAFYKVDKALLGLQPGAHLATPLKAIRDTLFATKQQAEGMVQKASAELQALPPEAPEVGEPAATTPEPKTGASVPTAQGETIFDLLVKGQKGRAGTLATDGDVVTLHGNPIFKLEGGKAYGSWGGHEPTRTTAANVNGLCLLAGLSVRPFSIQGGKGLINGKPVTDLHAWVELGVLGKTASVNLLAPRRRGSN